MIVMPMPRINARAGSSASNRMLPAVHLVATGVIKNKDFLKVTHSTFKIRKNVATIRN